MSAASILIAEDEAIVAADLANKLQQLGYRVVGSPASGEEAVALARQHRPDLVLIDTCVAGNMGGIAAAETIRRECDLPVVFLTAHSDAATLERAKLAEPFGYIVKPFNERELRTTIETALHKHQADRKVREQREWFRVTLSSIGDAVITCDTESRITFLNPVAEKVSGWTMAEVLGQPIQRVFRIINEQTRQPGDDPVARVLQEGRPRELANHTALIAKDGHEVPIEESAAPILDAACRVIGAVLVFHDVTEKRRAGQALEVVHQQRLNILESIGDGFFSLDRQWRVTYVNEKGARILGRSCEAMLGGNLWELFPEAVGSHFQQTYERVLAEQVSLSVEAFYAPLNSWFEARAYPSAEGLSIFYQDITERRRLEAQSRVQLAALEAAANAVAIISPAGVIEWVNAAFTQLTGWSVAESIGQNLRVLKSGQHPPEFYAAMWETVLAGHVWRGEVVNKRKDGSLYNEDMTVTPVTDASGAIIHLIAIKQDVTERKQAEEEVRQLANFPEQNPSPVLRVAGDGRLLYANAHGHECLAALSNALDQELPANLRSLVTNAFQQEKTVETEVADAYGRTFWFAATRPSGEHYVNLYGRDVTQRKLMDKALRASLDRYQSFLEVTGQVGWTTNADGEVVENMPSWGRFTGQSFEEMRGWGWSKAVHPDDLEQTAKVWRKAVAEGKLYEIEYRLRRHDGVYRYLLARGVPTFREDGSIREWVGTGIDISEIKHTELQLREIHDDLNRAQSVAHVGNWRLNVQRNELMWSEESWRIFGVPAGIPLTFETFLGTVHPEDRDYVVQQWTAALRGAPYDIEHRIVVGDAVKWVRERAVLELDAAGVVIGGFGTTQDVTERKLAAEAMRESEQRLQQAMRLGRCFAFEWSPRTDEITRTIECEPILGLTGEAAVADTGRSHLQRVHPEDRPRFVAAVTELTPAADTYTVQYRMQRSDGQTVALEETGRGDFDAGGRVVRLVGITFDVTERERAQRLREEHQSRLNTLLAVSRELLAVDRPQGILDQLADQARRLTKGRVGICGHGYRDGVFRVGLASRSNGTPMCPPGEVFQVQRGGVYQELLEGRDTIRYTTAQLKCHPRWRGLPGGHAPLQGLLGASLKGADGKPCGLVMVSARYEGEFTAEEELMLGQLATSASLALQRLEAKEKAERRADELATVFEAMTEGVIIYNAEGIPVAANQTVTEAYGFNPVNQRPEEFARKISLSFADGRRIPPNRLPSRRALRGATVSAERFAFTHADGRSCVTLTSAAPLRAGGKVTGAVLVWHDVTERERMVKELAAARDGLELRVEERTAKLNQVVALLRESEERYRTLFEAAPLGIALTDPTGRVLDANPSLCALFGVTLTEAKAGQAVHFYAKASLRNKLLAEVRRFGRVDGFETTLRTKIGTPFAALVQMTRADLHGRQVLLSIVQNITQRKQTEKHIQGINTLLALYGNKQRRKDYLHSVVELLRSWCDCRAGGLRLVDVDGCLPFAVSAGFTRRFLKQESLLCPRSEECPCLRVVQGRVTPGDKHCVSASGSLFCNHVSGYLAQFRPPASAALPCVVAGFESIAQIPIRFQNQVLGSIHLADQRTGRFGAEAAEFIETVAPLVGEALHRFQVEENLRESEERFRSMFESHAAIMLLIDPASGAIVDANPPAERHYGYSRSQLSAMKIEDLNIAAAAMPATGSRAGGGRAGSLVMRHRRADRSVRTVEVHSSPVQVAGRHLLFSIAHDITERKHLEKRILEIGDGERQRIGQDLHDSLGGHLAGLALMGKGLARALAKKNIEESAFAEEIAQGVNDAVTQTRAIARGLCPVGLGKLGLASSLEEYAGNQSRMLRVDCRVETRGQVNIHDESIAAHLFRIVQEAVTNAVRHGKARRIRIQLWQLKGALSLRVQDNGRGLPAKVAKGRGLGLPTMRYRAEVLGAQLEITSQRGKGTLISCRVPMQTRK